MYPIDLEYFRRRAAAERVLAKASDSHDVAEIHNELARQYDALVEHDELTPRLSLVGER